MGKKVEKISEMITENDENTFKNLLSVFDHDDDGALTFEELVDVKKALDTLTGFAEKGPKGVKPSLPLPDLIRTGAFTLSCVSSVNDSVCTESKFFIRMRAQHGGHASHWTAH